jgi:hypothetical protein
MLIRRLFLLGVLWLTACSSLPTPQERIAAANSLAGKSSWQRINIAAGLFDLAAYLPTASLSGSDLTIYVEGDGFAWLASDTPSPDPTPIQPIGLRLALAQPAGNAAYLARPCQYQSEPARSCTQSYWTNLRFAAEVIDASDRAISELKHRFAASRLTLVGYSGGAAVATLVAARRNDVEKLVTVAGNLDHKRWTTWHRVPPLTGSLNPVDYRDQLMAIPQWHFVGENDKTIPPALVREFAAGLSLAKVLTLPGYDHVCCWVENWSELWSSFQ